MRLPIELQMKICNNVYDTGNEIISGNDFKNISIPMLKLRLK